MPGDEGANNELLQIAAKQDSCFAFQNSLRSLPRKEFIRFSNLTSSQSILTTSQQLPTISKLIEHHMMVFRNCTHEFIPIYEIISEDNIELAGLTEFELQLLMKIFDQNVTIIKAEKIIKAGNVLINKLLVWYQQEKFPLRRARILIEKSKMAGYTETNEVQFRLELIQDAINLLGVKYLAEDSNLQHFRNYYLAIAHSWAGILKLISGQSFTQEFKFALTLWKEILNEIDDAKKNIDDTERFYVHLQMLADFFGVSNQHIYHIMTLKIMLRLNNGIRHSTIKTHSGYLFRVLIRVCIDEAKLTWMLGYSYYLCIIGNLNERSLAKNPKNRKIEQLLLADAFLTRSYISICLGFLEDAILNCKQAIRILNRMIRHINAINVFHGQSSFQGILSPSPSAQSRQWRLSKEADCCFKEGMLLIKETKACTAMSCFLLNLAELEYHRQFWKKSEENLNEAIEYQNKAEIYPKEEVLAKLIFGDFKYHEGNYKYQEDDSNHQIHCYNLALEYYNDASHILKNIMEKEYISNIEPFDISNKILISMTPKSKNDSEGTVQYECFSLEYLKARLFRHQGLLLSKYGEFEKGLRLIENGRFLNQPCLEKACCAEYQYLLGKVKLMEINNKLKINNQMIFDNIQDSVLSLPSFGKNSNKKQHNINQNYFPDNFLEEINKAIDYLVKVYDLIYECGPTHLLQEASLCIVKANLLNAYCYNKFSDQLEIATKCAYYLEMTKALTVKREFITILNEKAIKLPLKYNDNERWPQAETSYQKFLKDLLKRYKEESSLTYHQFQREFIDIIPSQWTVCSITVDIENNELYICRFCQKTSPLLLRLPLKRQSGECGGFLYNDVIRKFNQIMDLCDQSMKFDKKCMNKQEKSQWWNERKALDDRMKTLLENIEDCWLGGFKGILMADTDNDPKRLANFKEKMDKLALKNEICSQTFGKQSTKKKIDLHVELYRSFLRLGPNATDRDIQDIIYFLVDIYNKNNDQQIGYDEVDWDQLTVDIINALSVNANFNDSKSDDQHVILILDKYVQMLPWESFPCLRNQSVSRLPSISFLRDRILSMKRQNINNSSNNEKYFIDPQKTFYILNPSQDLENTQKKFEDFVKSFEGWNGVICRQPSEQECKNALSNNDLYIYIGHGTGEQYIKRSIVKQIDNCAVALLMGCSSGTLKLEGEFDPFGSSLNYLIAGCPALVANLWDVTDKDIDRFSKALFHEWNLKPNHELDNVIGNDTKKIDVSLVKAVSVARKECRLKFLIGAAPVIYGVPVYLK
ncbi:17314_t:CDS:10 [Entrophospora sp. SA101]|nr:17314_t:CDS:10 [Entrophospora sp. SA101]